jgi:hypothetical protein
MRARVLELALACFLIEQRRPRHGQQGCQREQGQAPCSPSPARCEATGRAGCAKGLGGLLHVVAEKFGVAKNKAGAQEVIARYQRQSVEHWNQPVARRRATCRAAEHSPSPSAPPAGPQPAPKQAYSASGASTAVSFASTASANQSAVMARGRAGEVGFEPPEQQSRRRRGRHGPATL